jgi:ribosomal protein L13
MEAAIIKPKLPKRAKLRKAFSKLSLFNGPQSPDIHTEGNSRN